MLQKWTCRRNWVSKKILIVGEQVKGLIYYDDVWSDKPGHSPGIAPVGIAGVLGQNHVFSEEEVEKLKKAYDLIKEVRDNYRQTHYELRSKIK